MSKGHAGGVGEDLLSWVNLRHGSVLSENQAHGIHSAREGFANNKQVWLNSSGFVCHQVASPPEASLDLIGDVEHVVLGAQLTHGLKVSHFSGDTSSVALDGFDDQGANVAAVLFKRLLDVFCVVVPDRKATHIGSDTRHERSEICDLVNSQISSLSEGDVLVLLGYLRTIPERFERRS